MLFLMLCIVLIKMFFIAGIMAAMAAFATYMNIVFGGGQ